MRGRGAGNTVVAFEIRLGSNIYYLFHPMQRRWAYCSGQAVELIDINLARRNCPTSSPNTNCHRFTGINKAYTFPVSPTDGTNRWKLLLVERQMQKHSSAGAVELENPQNRGVRSNLKRHVVAGDTRDKPCAIVKYYMVDEKWGMREQRITTHYWWCWFSWTGRWRTKVWNGLYMIRALWESEKLISPSEK